MPLDQARISVKSDRVVVPVLGMHYSGTETVARALAALGLRLSESLPLKGAIRAEAAPSSNEECHDDFFGRINAQLLQTMNCNLDGFGDPQQLLRISELSSRIIVEDFRLREMGQFIASSLSDGPWGWCDPRTVLTITLWQRMLGQLGFVEVRPLIVVRHPAVVVRIMSNSASQGTGRHLPLGRLQEMATDVWMAYNRILWQHCCRHRWLVCIYETITNADTIQVELSRLARGCGLDESRIADAVRWVGHSVGQSTHSAGSPEITVAPQAVELYNRFKRLANRSRTDLTEIPVDPDEARLLQKAQLLRNENRIDAAVDLLARALRIRPQYRAVRFFLSYTLMETGHITRSAEHSQWLIETEPKDPVGHGLRAFGLTQQARVDEAIMAFRECLSCRPANAVAWSNLLFTSLYSDSINAADVTALHIEAATAIEDNIRAESSYRPLPPRSIDDNLPARPLRIGYLSGDLKKHPVGYFLRSLLEHHDRQQVHVSCYHTSPATDELTTILRRQSDRWCDADRMTDDQLTQQIRNDAVDVLIDLSGHSSGNRCGVIVRRAAPVQALYLGYPATSGLSQMDFVIADRHLCPPEFNDLYTEQLQFLESCFLCFHPHGEAPEVASPPCEANGFITFGSFNNLPKISPTTVRIWSEVLKAVPSSRLAIKALSLVDSGTRELFYGQFAEQGIPRSRIDLLPPTVPLAKFLDEYRRLDIGLDPVPYNGGTTTCEALWMGVPVITLPGTTFCGRMGLSILRTLDLNEWIAESIDDYVRIAAQLASQPTLIAQYRRSLRERVKNSLLCNGQRFTADFEAACRSMVRQRASSGL